MTARWLRIASLSLAVVITSCSDATSPERSIPSRVVPAVDLVALTALGQIEVVGVTVYDQNGAAMPSVGVGWVSSDETVATVSDGIVTAVGNGDATLTATSGSASAEIGVTVAQVAASLVLSPDSVVLRDPGDTTRVSVVAFDGRGEPIELPATAWSSDQGSIATVDGAGLVTAVATGTATILARVDGAVAVGSVRVEPEVTLVAAGPTVLAGEVTAQLSLTVRVEDLLGAGYGGATVSWSTDAGSGSIASGSTTQSGATGHTGAVWRLGSAAGPQRARASIESRGNVVEVAFDATATPGPAVSAELTADSILLSGRGETAFLGPTYFDEHGNPTASGGVVWQSRDPGIASVLPDGLVTAVDPGATYVVGSFGSSLDSLLVTVSLRGAITVTFDDGFLTAYTNAFPAFQDVGLVGNIAVNPAQVGYPAYMTEAHLDEVHAAGFSIVSHTMTHDSLTTTSAAELDWELRTSQEWIEAKGYRGGNVFTVPYHVWGARERDAIGQYYEAARGISANSVSPDSLVSWRPSNPYELTGIEADDLPYTTVAGRDALRELLRRAVNEGAFIDVFFHHVPEENVDAFRETLAVLGEAEFRDRVLPYHELYPAFARSVF